MRSTTIFHDYNTTTMTHEWMDGWTFKSADSIFFYGGAENSSAIFV